MIMQSHTNKFSMVLDSSQITEYLACPMRWNLLYHKRLIPRGVPQEVEAMNAGTYGHKLMDIYYRARVRGLSFNQSIELCLAYNPDIDTCQCGCAKELHKEIPLINTTGPVESITECTRCNKCLKFVPKPFPLSQDVRFMVLNRLRDYAAKYASNDIQPLSEQHVEVGFSEPIYEDAENLFVLEGRMDLIGKLQGLQCVVDHKFQFKTHWLYPNSIQFKNYSLVARCPMMIINYVRLQKSITPDSLSRVIVTYSPHQLAAWKAKLVSIFFDIKKTIQSNTYEQRWNNCTGHSLTYNMQEPRYCWYNNLCEEPDLAMIEKKTNNLYEIQANPWRPW